MGRESRPTGCASWLNLSLPPPGFDDLSVDERIDYLQSLWNRIAASPETIPVPDWHREVIDERLRDQGFHQCCSTPPTVLRPVPLQPSAP
jgi:Putative addiction module component